MAGDYTRFTFRADRNYSGVFKQQGRVSLDADWNEGVAIDDRRWRSETLDLVGRCCVPETTPDAFRVRPTAAGSFDVGAGRCYVDGLQAENHGAPPQRYDAVLGELRGTAEVPYADQPFLPSPLAPSLTRPELPPIAGRSDLVYLDVWQREVTAIEDPALQEIALGGADTTTRAQTVWQVRALTDVGDVNCADDIAAWNELVRPSAGRLDSAAVATPSGDDPCELPPSGGYRGLENRLYRVEIHVPGGLGTARFKWSRDNASLVSRVEAIAGSQDRITVHPLGRDERLRFRIGDWVEIGDDHLELQGQPGHMAQITAIDEAARILTVAQPIPAALGLDATDAGRHTRVRRWDQRSGVDANGLREVAAGPIPLEDGVEISFSLDADIPGGRFEIGDTWNFAARTADGSVETLTAAPPRAVQHHYCRLAVVHWGADAQSTRVHDCRRIWPPAHCCTIAVRPGEDVQHAIDRVPVDGGCVCLLPGVHRIHEPLRVDGRQSLVLHGAGDASKLVYEPLPGVAPPPGRAALYVAGGSRDVTLADLLMWAEDVTHLVAIDGASRSVAVEGATLVNAADDDAASAVALGHCCDVTLARCRMLAQTGVLQPVPDALLALRTDLEALRAAAAHRDPEDDSDPQDPAPPEAPPLMRVERLAVRASTVLHGANGVRLEDAGDGVIEDNRLRGVSDEQRATLRRPPPDPLAHGEFAGPVDADDFYRGVDDALAALVPCAALDGADTAAGAPAPSPDSRGVVACVLHDFRLHRNHVEAGVGVTIAYGRRIRTCENRIAAARRGVSLGFAFDARLRGNDVRVPKTSQDKDHGDDPFRARRARLRPGAMAVSSAWAFGLEVCANSLHAPTGVGVSRAAVSRCEHVSRASLLEVTGITRIWKVGTSLLWFLYQLFALLAAGGNPSNASPRSSREEFEDDLEARLRGLLTGPWLRPFVGKAAIDDNVMETGRFGVFQQDFLTLGGIRVRGNRITCANACAVQQHPWFSVGLTETVAFLVRCLVTWLLAILVLLRDALASFLDEEEPEAESDGGPIGIVIAVISWVMMLCARLCGTPSDSDGEGEEPRAPVIDLKDALDDFLANANLCWLDEVVNQRYVIDGNTIAGGGDGIWTGLDGSQITDNTVTVWPRSSLPYEVVALGMLLRRHFESATQAGFFTDEIEFYAATLEELDRDALFIGGFEGVGWVGAHVDDPAFRALLRACVEDWAQQVEGGSPMAEPARAMLDGLEEENLDVDAVQRAWLRVFLVMVSQLRGYGIAMLGAGMTCRGNEVRARTACGDGLFGDDEVSRGPGIALDGRQLVFGYPAIGGIWQFSNLLSLLVDTVEVFAGDEKGDRDVQIVGALIALLLLLSAEERDQRVLGNRIDTALAHGIRSLGVVGMQDTEIMDNTVRDAWRHGILHRGLPMEQQREPFHAKVHRNSVHRSTDSRGFGRLTPDRDDFASLIWIEHGLLAAGQETALRVGGGATALLSHNHGDGAGLLSQRQAVHVLCSVAAVSANHVLTVTEIAIRVLAARGLFTDNVTDAANDVTPASLDQGPNVIV